MRRSDAAERVLAALATRRSSANVATAGLNRRFANTAPEGRLIRGHTVLFLDSFGLAALGQIVPYFEDLTVIRLVDFPTESERFISLIEESERVIVLSVERSSGYRLNFEIGAPDFMDRLEAGLESEG